MLRTKIIKDTPQLRGRKKKRKHDSSAGVHPCTLHPPTATGLADTYMSRSEKPHQMRTKQEPWEKLDASTSEYLPKRGLLRRRKRRREVDHIPHHEVPPLSRLLGDGHAQPGKPVLAAGLRGASLLNGQLLAVDGGDAAHPAREGLLEVQVHLVNEVVVDALEEGVWFLISVSVLTFIAKRTLK